MRKLANHKGTNMASRPRGRNLLFAALVALCAASVIPRDEQKAIWIDSGCPDHVRNFAWPEVSRLTTEAGLATFSGKDYDEDLFKFIFKSSEPRNQKFVDGMVPLSPASVDIRLMQGCRRSCSDPRDSDHQPRLRQRRDLLRSGQPLEHRDRQAGSWQLRTTSCGSRLVRQRQWHHLRHSRRRRRGARLQTRGCKHASSADVLQHQSRQLLDHAL